MGWVASQEVIAMSTPSLGPILVTLEPRWLRTYFWHKIFLCYIWLWPLKTSQWHLFKVQNWPVNIQTQTSYPMCGILRGWVLFVLSPDLGETSRKAKVGDFSGLQPETSAKANPKEQRDLQAQRSFRRGIINSSRASLPSSRNSFQS